MASKATVKDKRRRNLSDTRARILGAAKQRFSVSNYEQVGVRDIAADAGVDPALVNRYFGSKEKLFTEVITGVFDLNTHLPADLKVDELGQHLANNLMRPEDPNNKDCDPLHLLLCSAVSPHASPAISTTFHAEFVKPLAKLIGGPDANLRAALICSYAIGFLTMRLALRSPAIKPKDTRKALELLGRAIQDCLKPSSA